MGTSLPYARAAADQLSDIGSRHPILLLTGDGGFHLGKAGDVPIYRCNDLEFQPRLLIQAYGGQGHLCENSHQLFDLLINTASEGGLHLIEVPTAIQPEYQSETSKKLNTYIGFKNGEADATKKWQRLCEETC